MRSFAPLGVLGIIFAASSADAATLTGTVTGPDGAPFRAAFVQARNAGLKMTVSVLSDNQGKYVVENLPAGDYRLTIRAVGFKADAKSGVKLTADQNATQDFALQKGMVRWTDISIYQGLALLPDARGKKELAENCLGCHGFQSKMAATVRDEDGWRSRVDFMREAMKASLADRRGFSDKQAEDVVFYLNKMFGEEFGAAEVARRRAVLQGHRASVQRRGIEDRLRGLRHAGSDPVPMDRQSRQGREFLDPGIRPGQQGQPVQSDDRRDEGIPGPESTARR